ncbi:hypothetical protein AB0K23_01345 [Streptomyces sp. NPDC049602]|uniref:hypothetical protein n=1 Tax=Streptomyces sp. NPDC049602 TaxID=3155504 RepID=UPI003426C150
MNPNTVPGGRLYGRVTGEQGEKASTGVGGESGPQAGAEGFEPRAVLLDVISTTLNAAGYWLPMDGKRAVADALFKTRDDEAEKWRRQAVGRALELGRLQRTHELAEAAARTWLDDHNGADCARAVLDALAAYQPKEQP